MTLDMREGKGTVKLGLAEKKSDVTFKMNAEVFAMIAERRINGAKATM